jgi:enoyl-CoA hydratase/carnithine racemase
MFFGEKIGARRCETLGIVNRVVPDDQLREQAFTWAKTLAEGPAAALHFMKDNLDEALANDFLTSLDAEAERMVRSAATADHKTAVQAFIDKRKPVFAGT